MARKEITIDIQDREQLLTFKIKEMPATQLEDWIARASIVIAGSGIQVPDGADIQKAGAFLFENALAALGQVDYDKAKPLLDDLLGCCSRVIERMEERCTPASVDNYILDVKTLLKLRIEAVKINFAFLLPEGENLSDSLKQPATAMQ